jgi:cysteine dioxygenase
MEVVFEQKLSPAEKAEVPLDEGVEKKDKLEKLSIPELVAALTDAAVYEDESIHINKEAVRTAMLAFDIDSKEWKRYEFWDDKKKYTRNLIATDNQTFALILLCWTPGKWSPIHAHAGSECFMRCLSGSIREVKYSMPKSEEEELQKCGESDLNRGDLCFINDSMALHTVGNPHEERAVSLHCYMPPYEACKVYLEGTGKGVSCCSTFYSEHGVRIEAEEA